MGRLVYKDQFRPGLVLVNATDEHKTTAPRVSLSALTSAGDIPVWRADSLAELFPGLVARGYRCPATGVQRMHHVLWSKVLFNANVGCFHQVHLDKSSTNI